MGLCYPAIASRRVLCKHCKEHIKKEERHIRGMHIGSSYTVSFHSQCYKKMLEIAMLVVTKTSREPLGSEAII